MTHSFPPRRSSDLGDGCPGRVDGVGDRFDLLLQSLALGGDGVEMRKLRLEMGLEACGFEWLVANRAGLVVIKLECATEQRLELHTVRHGGHGREAFDAREH